MNHGAKRLEDGTYEFWWIGNRLSLEEFNQQTYKTATIIADEVDAVARGMSIKESLNAGQDALARLDEVEKILKLPLCDECRKLIGG